MKTIDAAYCGATAFLRRHQRQCAILLAAILLPIPSHAFSLVGPYESWMEPTNAYHLPGDIGGPMDIQCGYRWNVPILTYGFDQSFLDYFGTNGVAAVKEAIAILNNLRPASQLDLLGFPLNTRFMSPVAGNLTDLKSAALAALLQQLGLAQPARHCFDFRKWDDRFLSCVDLTCWSDWAFPDYIICRNYDPGTLQSSFYVNGLLYSGSLLIYPPSAYMPQGYAELAEFTVDPLALGFNAVAESALSYPSGWYYNGLSRDDVGGLKFLLSSSNVESEPLLPDVTVVSGPNNPRFRTAPRLGVDKLAFVEHPRTPRTGTWQPYTYRFVSQFLLGHHIHKQHLKRVVATPDILFRAADNGENATWTIPVASTDTAGWINCSRANGVASGAGPGLIAPPMTIAFQKLGTTILTGDDPYSTYPYFQEYGWSRLDGTTNPPITFPTQPQGSNPFTIRLRVWSSDVSYFPYVESQTWHLSEGLGAQAALQISTNQLDWTTLATATNAGSVVEWFYVGSTNPAKYFRVSTP